MDRFLVQIRDEIPVEVIHCGILLLAVRILEAGPIVKEVMDLVKSEGFHSLHFVLVGL